MCVYVCVHAHDLRPLKEERGRMPLKDCIVLRSQGERGEREGEGERETLTDRQREIERERERMRERER